MSDKQGQGERLYDQQGFLKWWHEEGSGLPPIGDEDRESHMMRVARIAWANGHYVATERVVPEGAVALSMKELHKLIWLAKQDAYNTRGYDDLIAQARGKGE